MKKIIKYSSIVAFCFLTVFCYLYSSFTTRAYAVGVGVPIPGSSSTNYTYHAYVSAIYSWSITIGSSLATLMVIYAGIKYLLSQGNPTQIGEAKEIAIGAVLGMILLLLAGLILKVLGLV